MMFMFYGFSRFSKKDSRLRQLHFERLESRNLLSAGVLSKADVVSEKETIPVLIGSQTGCAELTISIDPKELVASSELQKAVVGPEKAHGEAIRIIQTHRHELAQIWDIDDQESSSHFDHANYQKTEEDINPMSSELTIYPLKHQVVQVEVFADSSTPSHSPNSGGSGGSGGSGSSGGSVINPYLSGGGRYFYEGETVYISYSGLPSGCNISATVNGSVMVDTEGSVLSNNLSSSNLSIKTLDDGLPGADKYLSVHLSVSGPTQVSLTTSFFNLTFLERPEFLSSLDKQDPEMINCNYNEDSFRAYIDSNAVAQQLFTVDAGTISSKGGSGIRYKIVSCSIPSLLSYFVIDETSGNMSLGSDANCTAANVIREISRIVSSSGGIHNTDEYYQCDFVVRAYESRCVNGENSGNVWTDDATVRLTLSHWGINRNSSNERAPTLIFDGCTVSMLALSVGLNIEDWQNWLTVSSNSSEPEVLLFGGGSKPVCDLQVNDRLAQQPSIFQVPNTIFAAYCFDPGLKNGIATIGWDNNIFDLERLGFHVVQFDNSSSQTGTTSLQKKTSFLTELALLSLTNSLHGIYLVSHGNENGFVIPNFHSDGSIDNDNNRGWGASWSLNYRNMAYPTIDDEFGTWNNSTNEALWTVAGSLRYHMGVMIIHACEGVVSTLPISSNHGLNPAGGIFAALPGTFYLGPYTWIEYWNCDSFLDGLSYGGKQGTNRLS